MPKTQTDRASADSCGGHTKILEQSDQSYSFWWTEKHLGYTEFVLLCVALNSNTKLTTLTLDRENEKRKEKGKENERNTW